MTNSSDGSNLFLQEMGDIKPIKQKKTQLLKRDGPSELVSSARRESATAEPLLDANYLTADHVELLDGYFLLEFKRPGVQNGVFRKLKQGKYPQDARLDLHRLTVDKARKEVFDFIHLALEYDVRSLIIVHGKGNHGADGSSLMKSYVNKWLPEMAAVQAYCSAQQHHGGLGAVYVLLRKSDNTKQQNRDRISRGRVDV
ncbi:MAG: DNA-nicking Smr family endonuclease [Paraglaciecola psychrophila]|jgi:DNA-nicking Smr family endonuclease